MKVLSFSYCFPNPARPTWGRFVLERLAAVGRRPGVELQVVAPVPRFPVLSRLRDPSAPFAAVLEGLPVHYPRYFYFPKLLKSLDGRLYGRGLERWAKNLCGKWRPDVLDAHFVWPDGVGVSILARKMGLPYVITLRGWLYEAMRYPQILRQCVEAMRGATAIVSVSENLARTAVLLGVPAGQIHVIPNGVDTKRFRPRSKEEVRRQLGLPQDARLVASVAHLGLRKGHRETIRAMATLPPDVRLVIVGGDPARGRNRRQLHKLVNALGLNDRVTFAGPQSHDMVPLYYNAADVSVLASYREGCPNVVLESLASGTPVVATDVGSVPDMIEEGCNGKIVPPGTIAPLAEKIQEVLDSAFSPQTVRESPVVRSWDCVAEDVCNVLEAAIGLRCGKRDQGGGVATGIVGIASRMPKTGETSHASHP